MCDEDRRQFYVSEHARQFLRVGTVYHQVDHYRAMDDLARRRNVPAGYYRDDEHYLASIRGGGNANRNVLAQRRATAHGLSAMGYSHARIMQAMNATAAEVDLLLHRPPLAEPHMLSEVAFDPGELKAAPREDLNRSPDTDGFRTVIPARRANAVRRK